MLKFITTNGQMIINVDTSYIHIYIYIYNDYSFCAKSASYSKYMHMALGSNNMIR